MGKRIDIMTPPECEAARVRFIGEAILSQIAAPVADPTSAEIRDLVATMRATLAQIGGVGLAAPQIGVGLRVVLFSAPAHRLTPDDDGPAPLTALINPVVTPEGDALTLAREGCLSVPGRMGYVRRWRWARWSGFALDGRPVGGVAGGFRARVLQHECDHLDGVLYCQRLIEADQSLDDGFSKGD